MKQQMLLFVFFLLCHLVSEASPHAARAGIHFRAPSVKRKPRKNSQPTRPYQPSYQVRYHQSGYQQRYDPTGHGDAQFSYFLGIFS
ncbi:hypothetical protein Hamer_G004053 [Homarus americanus]|uniref:Secreted protein n=1 Tax=Homarus americanus TaxID=6706 RepID=A0A8J5MPX3_HOMAM|nr:hypothetical protein Hamer_G004053 [Homarus americanus]